MRQLMYVSSSTPRGMRVDVTQILTASRRNNLRHEVTGLLYTDGVRFLQVLEGPAEAIDRVLDRIRADPRHQGMVVLSDREIEKRQFGSWSMVHRCPEDRCDALDDRMRALLATASPDVQGTFSGLIAVRR